MNFLTNIFDGIKKRYILRAWITAHGAAATASIYLTGITQGWLMQHVPWISSEVEGIALAGVFYGILSSIIAWLFSKWLGKPIALLQREFDLPETRVFGERTTDALIDAINDPNTYAMSENGRIKICKPKLISEP